jgi:hypothetical protein
MIKYQKKYQLPTLISFQVKCHRKIAQKFINPFSARRLRTEPTVSDKKSTKKPRGKKRSLSGPDNEDDDTPTSKRREKEDVVATPPSKRRDKEDTVAIVPSKRREKEDVAVVTPLKTPTKVVAQNVAAATKSPVGVNRRNAVLFTRKKQAAVVLTPEPREDDSDLENKETEVQSPGKGLFS